MRLLVDGYNLMHQSAVVERSDFRRNALRIARSKLLELILDSIDPSLRSQTTIVYDASDPPPGLPEQYRIQGIEVLFARDWNSADELIQDLIRKHPTPRLLTVVSSDHAIHRVARARGATAIDSDRWLDSVEKRRWGTPPATDSVGDFDATPEREGLVDKTERDRWLDEFGFDRND